MIQSASSPVANTDSPPAPLSFWPAFRFWLKLCFISLGGPAGQISIMHQELVENRRWLLERLPLGGGHGAADKSFGPRQYVIHVIGVSAIIGMILKTLS